MQQQGRGTYRFQTLESISRSQKKHGNWFGDRQENCQNTRRSDYLKNPSLIKVALSALPSPSNLMSKVAQAYGT
ncbi:hypothetical protein BV378_07385 [Nostoc sp. RF31YmG]|nr:hypothetical protein BV378_07385 [Nostoc sp. RF31YmG]OUL33230.1 hypothetical protein BV375_07405 [Nostoc sp. 106C]